jgi:hypothetical protein
VIQQDTVKSVARNLILGRWALRRDGYLLLPNMSGMLLLVPASSSVCFVHISIYMKMRWFPIMHSITVLLTALNKMKTEGSGKIPVPITFLFIERLNKYSWNYASLYVLLLATNTFILNSHELCRQHTRIPGRQLQIAAFLFPAAPENAHGVCGKHSVTQY